MRIAIDGCCWSNRRGFGRFSRELVTAMTSVRRQDQELVLVVDRQTARGGNFPDGLRVEQVRTSVAPADAASADSSRSLADLWRVARAFPRLEPAVCFFPAVYTWVPVPGPVPVVVTLHDAIAERHPGLVFSGRLARLFWSLKVRHALWRADRVLTVSESARDQVATTFGLDPATIATTSEAPPTGFARVVDVGRLSAVRDSYGIPQDRDVILHVGGLSPHKNLDRLIEAVARLDPDSVLVLAGDLHDNFLGCVDDLRRRASVSAVRDRVLFVGFVAEQDLAALYSTASVLAMPSLMEGFGLPAVEAMACGTPVAASRGGSLPEVVGDAGLFFDAEDTREMAATLERMLRDRELRERLAQRALERSRRFSWEGAARGVLELLERTATRSRS